MHSHLSQATMQARIDDLYRYADEHRVPSDNARRRRLPLVARFSRTRRGR